MMDEMMSYNITCDDALPKIFTQLKIFCEKFLQNKFLLYLSITFNKIFT